MLHGIQVCHHPLLNPHIWDLFDVSWRGRVLVCARLQSHQLILLLNVLACTAVCDIMNVVLAAQGCTCIWAIDTDLPL